MLEQRLTWEVKSGTRNRSGGRQDTFLVVAESSDAAFQMVSKHPRNDGQELMPWGIEVINPVKTELRHETVSLLGSASVDSDQVVVPSAKPPDTQQTLFETGSRPDVPFIVAENGVYITIPAAHYLTWRGEIVA